MESKADDYHVNMRGPARLALPLKGPVRKIYVKPLLDEIGPEDELAFRTRRS